MSNTLDRAKKKRKLKLFNGSAHGKFLRGYHAYVAAYSIADASDVMTVAFGGSRKWTRELNVYWHKGHWGNAMEGITPERGCWVAKKPTGKPERIV